MPAPRASAVPPPPASSPLLAWSHPCSIVELPVTSLCHTAKPTTEWSYPPASARITDILTHHLGSIVSNSPPHGGNHPSTTVTSPAVPPQKHLCGLSGVRESGVPWGEPALDPQVGAAPILLTKAWHPDMGGAGRAHKDLRRQGPQSWACSLAC